MQIYKKKLEKRNFKLTFFKYFLKTLFYNILDNIRQYIG